MDFGTAASFLEKAQIALEEGDLGSARNVLASCIDAGEPPVYEGWTYEAPPINEGVLDFMTKSRGVHKLAKMAGIHTKTNVRDDLQHLHHAGQNAIAMSDRAHKYNKGASSKDPMDHPDQDVAIAQHHSAIKAHNAVIGRLDKAAKNAAAAKDHDAMAWIQHAKDVHTQHRDWNMKMARNMRFGGAPASQQQNSAPKQKAAKNGNGAQHQTPQQQQQPSQQQQSQMQTHAPAGPGPMARMSPYAGRGTINTQTGQRIGAFNPQTGQRMNAPMSPGGAAMAAAGIGHQPMQQAPQQPQVQKPKPGQAVKRVRRKAKAPPMAAAESIEATEYLSLLEKLG